MSAHRARLARLRRLITGTVDALVVTHRPNLLYLAGFTGSSGVLVVTRRGATLFVPALYRLQAGREVIGAQVRAGAGSPLRAAARWLSQSRLGRVGFEEDYLPSAQIRYLQSVLPASTKLMPTAHTVETLRAIKEVDEIARIRSAHELTVRVFNEVLPSVRPGVRELDLAAELEYRMKLQGASGPAFETIVASGPRSALPHGRASRKRLKKNELVVIDLGVILADYRSDMTRTVYLGTPSSRVKRTYSAVREALERARRSVRAGVKAAEVDATARRCLTGRGLGKYFIHGTGHGLGLEVHEEPRVSGGAETPLKAGNVITLEPGVYVPGWGGVRIEDVVVVRARGYELLTPLSSELLCL
jgi:Xaa-Pro aminopeptidase